MFWRIFGTVLLAVWVVNAFQMLGCQAVTFFGSRRLVQWSCVQDGVPGPLAGLAMIALAGILLWNWWGKVFRAASDGPGQNARSSILAGRAHPGQGRGESIISHPEVLIPDSLQPRSSVKPGLVGDSADQDEPISDETMRSLKPSSGTSRQYWRVNSNESRDKTAGDENTTRDRKGFGGTTEGSAVGPESVIQCLERLARLHDAGYLKRAEYENLKRLVIEGL